MIKVKYTNNGILIEGHANQNEYGNDIVCASVSTSIILSINLIEKFNLLNTIKYDLKEGYFRIEVIKSNDIVNNILENLKYTLNDLYSQYPKYIIIS